MPRIKRWFHVSHDINSDGEVWELTDKFGVSGLRLWLELLSIADRNEGSLPPLSDSFMRQLSIKCNTTQTRVRLMCDWTQTQSWVVCDPAPRVRNWLVYNPPREAKKSQTASPPNPPNPPNLPNLPSKIPLKRKNATAYPEDFEISESLKSWCVAQGVNNPMPHLEAFRDYHVSKGSRFIDWAAAFRTWVRNRSRFGPPRAVNNNEHSEQTQRILKRGL